MILIGQFKDILCSGPCRIIGKAYAPEFVGKFTGTADSATNTDKLDGYHGSSGQSANTYVLRDSNGYIYTNYINSNTSNSENPTISQIVVTNGSDNFYRKASLSHLKNSLGSMPASDVYPWAKASTKPSYAWNEIADKPSSFTPSSHSHNYAGSSSAGGAANSLSGFTNTTTSSTAIDSATQNGHVYVSGTSDIYGQSDGAAFVHAYSTSWVAQIYQDYRTGQIALRGKNNGTWQAWRKVLDSTNYTSYTPTKTGSGASGTWGISITGTANGLTPTTISSIDELDSFSSANAVMKYAKASTCNIGWGSNDGLVLSLPWSGTYGAQIAIDDQSNWMGIRTKNNGTWNSWSKLALTTDNVASATKLTSSAGSSTQPVYFSDGKPVACGFTLPSPTTSDNGKILSVVNGAYSLISVTNAEGVKY